APLGSKFLGLERSRTRLAEGGRPLVGGILEDRPNDRPVPGRLPRPGGDSRAVQASADFTDRTSVLAHPGEDQADDARLVRYDLIARFAVPLVLADVSVSVGRAAEHTDRTLACGVPLAATAALQDLGLLVLGNDALDLDQEILRRS